ncbi:unnamed protein product [Urochloa humidicola]
MNSARKSFDHPDDEKKELASADERLHPVSVTCLNSGIPKARGMQILAQEIKESINDEQRLESAWLQVSEKHTPGLMNQAKHDQHQVLSQVVDGQHQRMSSMTQVVPSSHRDDDLAHEIEALKIVDSYGSQKHQSGRSENGFAISPSKLHRKDDMADCDRESVCSEPGRPGCHGLFPCWKAQKPKGAKAKKQVRVKFS